MSEIAKTELTLDHHREEVINPLDQIDVAGIENQTLANVLGSLTAEQRSVVGVAVNKTLKRKAEHEDELIQRMDSVTDVEQRYKISRKHDRFLASWRGDVSLSGIISQFLDREARGTDVDEDEGTFERNLGVFEMACKDANSLVGHCTPRSIEVVENSGLSGKEKHGVSTTNDYAASQGVHFTSLELLIDASGHQIDYKKYATLKLKQDQVPGVFMTRLGTLVQDGFNNIGLGFAPGHEPDTPIVDLVATNGDDRGRTEIPLQTFDFVYLKGRTPAGGYTDFEARVKVQIADFRKSLHAEVKAGEVKRTDAVDRFNQKRLETLKATLEERFGAQAEWASKHIFTSLGEYLDSQQDRFHQTVAVPLCRSVKETGLRGEVLDGANQMFGYSFGLVELGEKQ